ncbi:hypothetical protein P7C73_g3957, partial [Tremellales sp. Uapishka_1]
MFNSPAPRLTPRRTLGSRRDRDTLSRGTSVSDVPATPSARSSRFQVIRGSPTSSAGETVRTVRNEGPAENERLYWGRDDRHAVASVGQLPTEVLRLVRGIDLITNSIVGQLDPHSGFAFVLTPEVCIAWNYSKRTHSSPTCYSFPVPSPTKYQHAPPSKILAALYTASSNGEPGMIVVSTTGEIRFWESMSLALANVDRCQSVTIELPAEDFVDRIWKCDGNTFVITTTSSLAFRLSISSAAGRVVPALTALTRPGGMFGRATPQIFGGRSNLDKEGVMGVVANGGAGSTYLMAKRTIQKWVLGADGGARFGQEYDLHAAVGTALYGDDEQMGRRGGATLDLDDLVAVGNDGLAVLVSYTLQQSSSLGQQKLQNSHAIVLFEIHSKSNALMVNRVVPITYLAHPDARLLDVPRLHVPAGSPIAFVHFADVIVMVSLLEGAPYEDVITLKDSSRYAFIGVGSQTAPSRRPSTPTLLAMPMFGGLMSLEVDANAGRKENLSQEASATARLKSKMEQAVFFGDRSDNPLSFDLPPGFRGDLAEAAEAVSAEIVASSSVYMPAIYELRPQLSDRLVKLKELMSFIRRNGFLSMLSQATRRRLSRDAEKVKGAIDLWDYQNRHMDQMHSSSPQSLLSDSIALFMNQSTVPEDEDVVRLFFRTQVENIDRLLETVFADFKNVLQSADNRTDLGAWVTEANRIFIIVLRSAFQYREAEMKTYEENRERPSIELWTAQNSFIEALDYLYSTTEKLIKERTRTLGSVIDEVATATGDPNLTKDQKVQFVLKQQMTDIAASLCTNMEDKMRTSVTRQLDGGADPREGEELSQRWADMKPRIIRPLVGIDRVAQAYELAEHHSDFPTLVYLCNDPVAGTGPARIQSYIERFGQEFAFVLYQWYIDQGQPHALLSQDEVYGSLLTEFFRINQYPELAWLHHISCKRYGEAAKALLVVDVQAEALSQKHMDGEQLITSIGKLAAVAEIKSNGSNEKRKKLLIDLEDELDHVTIQNNLRETIIGESIPEGYKRKPSVEKYVDENVTLLDARLSFKVLFASLARRLVDGAALDVESLIDVLTLKDNRGVSSGDAAIALDRLMRDQDLPEGRKQVALLSIWRRVFIRDDWASISNTSGRSEESQRQILRQTSTYHTLQGISANPDFPRNFILSPYTASQPPLSAELAARFPELSAEEVEGLMADHEDEIRVLRRAIEENGLEARVREIGDLVKADSGSVDVEM